MKALTDWFALIVGLALGIASVASGIVAVLKATIPSLPEDHANYLPLISIFAGTVVGVLATYFGPADLITLPNGLFSGAVGGYFASEVYRRTATYKANQLASLTMLSNLAQQVHPSLQRSTPSGPLDPPMTARQDNAAPRRSRPPTSSAS